MTDIVAGVDATDPWKPASDGPVPAGPGPGLGKPWPGLAVPDDAVLDTAGPGEAGPDEAARPRITEVDGVPVLLGPREGPSVTGGIVLRVGTADETAAIAGITHLVEHLVLSRVYTGSVHENGEVRATATLLHATGTPEAVVAFLNGVCAALRDLPTDRLELEKQIILTEATRRGSPSPLLMTRHGVQGHGLASIRELGMHTAGADEVRAWSNAWFTRGNAVAFLTMPSVPGGLDLTLPAGPRRPDPVPYEILAAAPAYVQGPDEIVVEGITERSSAASVFSHLARRVLFERLRGQEGVSYTVDSSYRPRDATSASIALFADARPDTVVRASEIVLGTVHDLCTREIPASELALAVSDVRQGLDGASPADLLPSQALALLQGRPVQTAADVVADAERVTAEDIRRVAGQLRATALVRCAPAAVPLVEAAGIERASRLSEGPVRGGVAFRRTGMTTETLRISPDGITRTQGRTQHTVRFAESPALLCWPDGGRALIDADGTTLPVEPTLYGRLSAAHVQQLVDARMDPSRVVRLPERDPQTIPRFTGRDLAFVLGWIVLLSISVPLLVAAVVAGITDGALTGVGVAVLGAPFWIATAWMTTIGVRRQAGRGRAIDRRPRR